MNMLINIDPSKKKQYTNHDNIIINLVKWWCVYLIITET